MDEFEGAAYDELMDRIPPWERQHIIGGVTKDTPPPQRIPPYQRWGFIRKSLWWLVLPFAAVLTVVGVVAVLGTLIFPPIAIVMWFICYAPMSGIIAARV